MRLIEFLGTRDEEIYINPEYVTHVKLYRPGSTLIFLNNSKSDIQNRIVVQESLKKVIKKLSK
jgi:uncharacterized protein YlzI (FlbEa/FlbD family)